MTDLNDTQDVSDNVFGKGKTPTGRGLQEGPCGRVRHPKAVGPTAVPSVKADTGTPQSGTTLNCSDDAKGNQVNARGVVGPTMDTDVTELTGKGKPSIPYGKVAMVIIGVEISFDGQFVNIGQGNDSLYLRTAAATKGDAAKFGDMIGHYTVVRSPLLWRPTPRTATPTGTTTTRGRICCSLYEALSYIDGAITVTLVPMIRKPAALGQIEPQWCKEVAKGAFPVFPVAERMTFDEVTERRGR